MLNKINALLTLTTAMTGGKRELRERVKNIGRRPRTLWLAVIITLATLAVATLAACMEFKEPDVLAQAPVTRTATAEQTLTPDSWEQVETLVSARRYPEAMAALGKIDTEEAQELLAQLRYIVNGDYIACAGWTVAALTPPGGVALSTSEDWSYKQEMLEAYNWGGVTALSLEDYGVVGIGPDNTLLYASQYTPEFLLTKSDAPNQAMGRALEDMANWPPAYVFDACYPQTAIALTAEGVYASYPNGMYSHVGKLDGWTDVVDVRDGRSYALGLKADGMVLYRNFGTSSVLDVSAWRDIVAIDAGWVAVGLKSDGTVVCEDGEFDYLGMDVSGWNDIIAVSTCEWCTLGLKSDGTVVATGDNRYHQLDVSDWRDVVAIDTSPYLSIGLKADGTLVIAGDCSNTNLPLPDVSGMTGLYVPAALASATQNAPETYDFDGDGLADSMRAGVTPASSAELSQGNANVKLIVDLASGQTLEKTIDGWWWDARCMAGDFDADGKTDLALIMEVGGSNYGATGVFVYRVENGALVEFPNAILTNEKVKYAQQEYTSFQYDQCACVGANVLHEAGRDLLRLRMLNDYDPGAGVTNAWYLDTAWNGEGWRIEEMNLGEAYGEDKLIEMIAVTPDAPPDAAAAHRPGFVEAELTVVGDKSVDIDAIDFDVTYQMQTLSLRQKTQLALRWLYDMTGVLVESCNIDTKYGLCLTMTEDGDHESFFSANVDSITGYVTQVSIGWKQPGFENSPLDPADCILPENAESTSAGELCQWFYGNLGYQREVVSAEELPNPRGVVDYVKLHLANGEFYEMYLSEAVGLPNSFYGPYPEGFTH